MLNFIRCSLVNNFNRIWFNSSLFWCWWLLLPISWLYGFVSVMIRLSYRLGWRKVWRAPLPVVIVGNLTTGGNGKTPVVIWLVEQLKKRGISVCVVSRGYGGKTTYPLLLNEYTKPTEAGDEPVLIYQRTGVPVAVAPDRSRAIQAIIDANLMHLNSLQMVIADDGLQHYALARDIEIVVIDGTRRFGNGYLLPAGPMRERSSRLRSVDAVIVNGGGVVEEKEIIMQLRPRLAINMVTNEQREVAKLGNLVAMAGIGYPPHFFAILKQYGAQLDQCISMADHQTLRIEEICRFTDSYQELIMTEKDAVKYHSSAKKNWWYLPVDAEINNDKSERLLQRLVLLAMKNI